MFRAGLGVSRAGWKASPRLIAFRTPRACGMEEQERIASQVLERDPDNITSTRQPCSSVSYAPFGLESPLP
jgi:hypothetical protein